jgi:hypothetical protein
MRLIWRPQPTAVDTSVSTKAHGKIRSLATSRQASSMTWTSVEVIALYHPSWWALRNYQAQPSPEIDAMR